MFRGCSSPSYEEYALTSSITTSGVVDLTTALGVVTKYLGGFFVAHISHDRDTAMLQLPDPVWWFRSLVEAGGAGVFVVCSTDHVTDSRPGDGAETHGARLGAGNQLVGRLPFGAEIKVSDGVLREHNRHYLGVSNGTVSGDDEVYARGHEPASVSVEDRRPKRTSSSMLYVCSREPNRKPHPILGGWVRHVRIR